MIDFFAGLFALIILATILFGPILLIIIIIRKVKKNKKNKFNDDKEPVFQNIVQQPIEFKQDTIQQQFTKTDDKEMIDEYYQNQYIPYRPKYFLTKNEYYFYKELKEIAKDNNLVVLAKIRLADLVEVEPMEKSKWQTYFNKINKKHVDFALANPQNLQIKLLIELDDYSHNEQQYERDRFVEAIYNKTGYKLLRVKGTFNLKEKIEGTLKQY